MEDGKKQSKWFWLPAFMPRVAGLIADRRVEEGDDWVNHCWHHGVVLGQPGFFWAVEGAIAVGVPVNADVVLMHHKLAAATPGIVALDMACKPTGWAPHATA